MKLLFYTLTVFILTGTISLAQKTSSGNPSDFKIKTCLHSVNYVGFCQGQERIIIDKFLVRAKKPGYESVILVAKRPHLKHKNTFEFLLKAITTTT